MQKFEKFFNNIEKIEIENVVYQKESLFKIYKDCLLIREICLKNTDIEFKIVLYDRFGYKFSSKKGEKIEKMIENIELKICLENSEQSDFVNQEELNQLSNRLKFSLNFFETLRISRIKN